MAPEALLATCAEQTDEQLAVATAGGDEGAFRTLMNRHKRSVLCYLHRFVGDPAWAEDLAQETFVRVFRHAGRYDPTRGFSLWLLRIARNLAFDHLRSRRSEERVLTELQARTREAAPAQGQPEAAALRREAEGALETALASVPESFREVLVLCDVQGLSYQEVSELTETPVKTVSTRLFRARQELRQAYRRYADGSNGRES